MRVQPSQLARKAGAAVNWVNDFESAERQSRETGKPIFWYVPTIRGTFMDRKAEIDRYMMAGVFSWPRVINVLNTSFVCVKAPPTREQQKRFELSVYKFVEPGFLVLKSGEETLKIDRVTTQNLDWFVGLLAGQIEDNSSAVDDPVITALWDSFREKQAQIELVEGEPTNVAAHKLMMIGMKQFRSGQHSTAKATWEKIVTQRPDHPLAWKAAAEIEGIGPFVRGFEIHCRLPDKCMQAGIKSQGSRAPLGSFSKSDLWTQGVEFLLGMQNESGGFFDCDYDFGGTDSLPNVHIAITSLAGMALIEAKKNMPNRTDAIQRAINKCLDYVGNESNINRVDRDEILWADAYRLRFICKYKQQNHLDKNAMGKLEPILQSAVNSLQNIQSKRGSWYHEYENSFVTATALCALFDAERAGATIDKNKVEKGLAALADSRSSIGTFPYASKGKKPATVAAAAGRMPICELALVKWGRSDQAKLVSALNSSFQHHDNLDVALKYDDHTSRYAYGGFFFWYDMRSRTEAINQIADIEVRNSLMAKQLDLIMKLPEIDGCFVDSHELGRCYGTSMALLCLAKVSSMGVR